MRKFNWLISIVIPFYVITGCSSKANEDTNSSAPIVLPVTELITQNTELKRSYVGELEAVQNVEIRARVRGYLEKIFVDEGKEVTKGQLLFQIADEEFEAEVAKAKANLKTAMAEAKSAEVNLKQIQGLVDKKVVSNTELELAKAKFDAVSAGIEEAQSALSNARINLSYTSIRAPFDGVIDRIPFKTGSLINEGTLLTTVSDLSAINAYFNVSETDYLAYIANKKTSSKKNNKVELVLADGTRYSEIGNIETMQGQFEEGTGSIAFRARFSNPKKLLKHGSTGTIILTNYLNKALVVPQKSAFEIQDKHFVYVVDDKNVVKMRSFLPKFRHEDFYVVESGLNPGERVVYEGIQKVQEGMTIEPREAVEDTLQQMTTSLEEKTL